ncbi:MAG: glycerate kinase [Bacteroidetes bacterium]|nr:glycerate kinase [Bacteroidota bacterium]
MGELRVLIAPNAFKHSLDADAAALAIEDGLRHSSLSCSCELFPVGDGGDGTGELIIKKCGGELVNVAVRDPLGRPIFASYGLIDGGGTAVIEMANASGLRLLAPSELNPLRALSFGTGQQMLSAVDKGVRRIVIGMGGSATVDGGVGILQALGCRFLDEEGVELSLLPGELVRLGSVDVSGMDKRVLDCEVVVLCDVDNFLLGAQGAAAMFGPQKGAKPEDVRLLDAGLERLAAVALRQLGRDMASITYGGTAGGASAGLFGFLNASLVNGIDYFLQLTGFEASVRRADIVITGEGSIDEQTLQGKGPFGVAAKAKEYGLPVIALAGKVPLGRNEALLRYFDVLLAIGNGPVDLPEALRSAGENMKRTGWEIGNMLAMAGASSTIY